MSMLDISLFVGFFILASLVLLAVLRLDALSYLYDSRVKERGIEFVFFSLIRVYFLPYEDIEYVKEVRGGYFYLTSYNFKNRFFHKTFLIKKKKGIFTRQILVTPENAAAFSSSLERAAVRLLRD